MEYGPKKHTLAPYVTGASVLGVVYKDGVMMAADARVSYGRMELAKTVPRFIKVNETTAVGMSGEYSDFQYIKQLLGEVETEDWVNQDGDSMDAKQYASYLGRVMYNRRTKFDPLYNQVGVAGYKEGKPFLAYIDLNGTAYEETTIASGMGQYFARPLLRQHHKVDMTEAQAKELLEMCMRVLFYRDCSASHRLQICKATAAGIEIGEPYALSHNWSFNAWTRPSTDFGLYGTSW
uniref:Proteasome subunit beta n=1 Tax=Chromera velia CCMP2878 TaxID=1169474 RepID=A0A0G4H5M7_9ALVE|mmetsp:Transcript_32214/g.63926  ORF Transcript_32214/g.63926 Transcript_32214/m.63926 type:complete len:235 (+) Transcript_32214:220-924(+)